MCLDFYYLNTAYPDVKHSYPTDKEAKTAFFMAVEVNGRFNTKICNLEIIKYFQDNNDLFFSAIANFPDGLKQDVQGRICFDD